MIMTWFANVSVQFNVCGSYAAGLLKMGNQQPTIALKVPSQFNQHRGEQQKNTHTHTPKTNKNKKRKDLTSERWQLFITQPPPPPNRWNAMVILFVARLQFITQWANINAMVIWNRNITNNVCRSSVSFYLSCLMSKTAASPAARTGAWLLFVYFFLLVDRNEDVIY